MKFLEQGYLTNLAEIKLGDPKQKIERLTAHNLMRIATILGHLSKENDLYNLLFEQPAHKVIANGVEVNTRDLAMFILMDHMCTRGHFMKFPGSSATSDTTMCQGVPVAFEGAKRVHNKTYMSWLEGIDLSDYRSMIKVDIFLPADLGSLIIDGDTGEPKPSLNYGLLTFYKNNIVFPESAINQIKEQVPNWRSAHLPKMVDAKAIDDSYGKHYNKCGHKLRALILQGWVFSTITRTPSMITNLEDWDTPGKDLSNSWDGMTPKGTTMSKGVLSFLGDDYSSFTKFKAEHPVIKEEERVKILTNKDNLKI